MNVGLRLRCAAHGRDAGDGAATGWTLAKMDEYPDNDFPWTLYFQGAAMPRWANCWHFQRVADSSVDEYVGQVYARLHHVGCIESEESDVFAMADEEEVVFWTSGYAADQARLAEAIRSFRLGESHPDYFGPPHRIRSREDALAVP